MYIPASTHHKALVLKMSDFIWCETNLTSSRNSLTLSNVGRHSSTFSWQQCLTKTVKQHNNVKIITGFCLNLYTACVTFLQKFNTKSLHFKTVTVSWFGIILPCLSTSSCHYKPDVINLHIDDN